MVFTEKEKRRIYMMLDESPELEPIFTSASKVPEKIRRFDDKAFVVFNHEKGLFEIHSEESYFPEIPNITTYQTNIPHLEDDVLEILYYQSHKIHGRGGVIKNIHELQKRREKAIDEVLKRKSKRSINNFIKDIKGEKYAY